MCNMLNVAWLLLNSCMEMCKSSVIFRLLYLQRIAAVSKVMKLVVLEIVVLGDRDVGGKANKENTI